MLWIWVCVAGIAFPLNACILILKNSNWWLIHLSNITQGCLIKLYATILVWMFLGALFQMGLRTRDGHRKILWSPAVIQTSGLNTWNYLYLQFQWFPWKILELVSTSWISRNGYSFHQFLLCLFPLQPPLSPMGSYYLFDQYLNCQKHEQFCKLQRKFSK